MSFNGLGAATSTVLFSGDTRGMTFSKGLPPALISASAI
eukprot:CAMPEP_0177777992 /NCGR_PEP_ID=MMETSP0491_2-20121128/15692_1 /TAXON_ID=63592 /ORGANISM="Tetraselmis chuii, Strain PLY429" /LENGTH=38 /DNA_ID= /DNA_START= /DNA_END= /DNA_ORIENTATION=